MAIVAVANAKGGVGKTATVVNLHEALGAFMVIDADIHGGVRDINQLRDEPWVHVMAPMTAAELIELISQDNQSNITIIDCGGYDDEMSRLAIANADMVVVPSNDDPSEELGIIKIDKALREIGDSVEKQIVGYVLLNRVHHARTQFAAFDGLIDAMDNLERIPHTIPHSKDLINAMRTGCSVKSGAIPVRYAHLAKYIKNHLIAKGAYK